MNVTLFSLKLIKIIYIAKIAYIALLFIKKVKILIKYLEFLDIFLEKKTLILLELIKLNEYIIKL